MDSYELDHDFAFVVSLCNTGLGVMSITNLSGHIFKWNQSGRTSCWVKYYISHLVGTHPSAVGSDCCAHEVFPNEILPTVLLFLPQFLENTKITLKCSVLTSKNWMFQSLISFSWALFSWTTTERKEVNTVNSPPTTYCTHLVECTLCGLGLEMIWQ